MSVIQSAEIRAQRSRRRDTSSEKIISIDQAATIASDQRTNGRRVVFTNGCFDLLHVGHVTSLSEAASWGDLLIVAMNTDQSIRRLKGETRPVIGQSDRATMLTALECVDYVVPFDENTPLQLLHAIRPDVLVKGGSYSVDQVVGHEVVESYGGVVAVTRLLEGMSTTDLLQRIQQSTGTPLQTTKAA